MQAGERRDLGKEFSPPNLGQQDPCWLLHLAQVTDYHNSVGTRIPANSNMCFCIILILFMYFYLGSIQRGVAVIQNFDAHECSNHTMSVSLSLSLCMCTQQGQCHQEALYIILGAYVGIS